MTYRSFKEPYIWHLLKMKDPKPFLHDVQWDDGTKELKINKRALPLLNERLRHWYQQMFTTRLHEAGHRESKHNRTMEPTYYAIDMNDFGKRAEQAGIPKSTHATELQQRVDAIPVAVTSSRRAAP